MFKELTWQEKAMFAMAFLMSATLVLRDQLISPAILLFFLSTIPFWKGNKRIAEKKLVFPMLALFAVYAFSMIFAENTSSSLSAITTKLSFLIFPIIALLMTSGFAVAIKGLKWGLILASFASMSFSLIRAVILEGGFSGDAFHANVYAVNMHASYLSIICILSCAFVMVEKNERTWFSLFKWGYLGLTIVSIFYLRSLGAFVCIATIFLALPIWKTLRTKNWKWLITLPLYALLFWLGLKASDRISQDVGASVDRVAEWSKSPKEFIENNVNNIESNTVRLVVWTITTQMIAERPFGVGLGDESDLLVRQYYKFDYTGYAERNLNPHNQFLQTGLSIGFMGIILLIVLFVMLIYAAYRTENLALFIAALCISVSCLFESMLERQVGVIFLSIILLIIALAQVDRLNVKEEV